MSRAGEIDYARRAAIGVMARAASSGGVYSLTEICAQVEPGSHGGGRPIIVRLCRAALAASLDAGNWREQRAEAECKLREGWAP